MSTAFLALEKIKEIPHPSPSVFENSQPQQLALRKPMGSRPGRICKHMVPFFEAPFHLLHPWEVYQAAEVEFTFGDRPQNTELLSLESEEAELILRTWRPARVHSPNRARARNERSSRR